MSSGVTRIRLENRMRDMPREIYSGPPFEAFVLKVDWNGRPLPNQGVQSIQKADAPSTIETTRPAAKPPTPPAHPAETPLPKASPTSDRSRKRLEILKSTGDLLLTVSEAAEIGPLSESALRHLIFKYEAARRHPEAGLSVPHGFERCIVRPNGLRRVFIDKANYLNWLNANKG